MALLALLLLGAVLAPAGARFEHRGHAGASAGLLRQYLERHRHRLPADYQWLLETYWPVAPEPPLEFRWALFDQPHGDKGWKELELPPSAQVVVFGAGVSGLTAALELAERGHSGVVVLEKMDRVGGRVQSETLTDGTNVDVGGQWIAPTQYKVRRLIHRFNLTLFPTYYDERSAAADFCPADARPCRAKLNAMAHSLPRPLSARHLKSNATLAAWDRMSLSQWVDADACAKGLSFEGKLYLKSVAQVSLNQDGDTMSLLFYLQAVQSFGSIEVDEGLRGGAQDSQLVEGTQAIAKSLARAFRAKGGRIYLGVTAKEVAHGAAARDNGVVITTAGGQAIHARALVVAMGSGDRQGLHFQPPLPAHDAWAAAWPSSDAYKMFLVFDRATWRNDSRVSVPALSLGGLLPIFDNSLPSGEPGVAMALFQKVLPEPLQEWAFAALVGLEFGAWGHKAYLHKTWSVHGDGTTGYRDDAAATAVHNCVGGAPPGALSKHAAGWRQATATGIHWAGSDTATEWQGYIDGAVDSGQRAAAEVAAELEAAAVDDSDKVLFQAEEPIVI